MKTIVLKRRMVLMVEYAQVAHKLVKRVGMHLIVILQDGKKVGIAVTTKKTMIRIALGMFVITVLSFLILINWIQMRTVMEMLVMQ